MLTKSILGLGVLAGLIVFSSVSSAMYYYGGCEMLITFSQTSTSDVPMYTLNDQALMRESFLRKSRAVGEGEVLHEEQILERSEAFLIREYRSFGGRLYWAKKLPRPGDPKQELIAYDAQTKLNVLTSILAPMRRTLEDRMTRATAYPYIKHLDDRIERIALAFEDYPWGDPSEVPLVALASPFREEPPPYLVPPATSVERPAADSGPAANP